MTIPVKPPVFASAPKEYDPNFFDSVLKALTLYIREANTAGAVECSNVVATHMPTSPTGLRAGTLYNDNGTVKIVLSEV